MASHPLTLLTCFLLASGASAAAMAADAADCNNPEAAQVFAAGFQKRLMAALESIKNQEKTRIREIEALKKKVIDAGAWTNEDAQLFMVNAALLDSDAKALEVVRKKAADSLKVQLYAIAGLEVIASNKAEENRATCLLGQKALALSEEVNLASGNSWQLLESKINNYARTKSVAGF